MPFPTGDSKNETELPQGHRFSLHRFVVQPSTDSREISEGIVLDYDANGHVTGIDIDNASNKVDFDQIVLNKLPTEATLTQ